MLVLSIASLLTVVACGAVSTSAPVPPVVSPIQPSVTVVVDPAKVAPTYDAATCGAANTACRTIADGITKAKVGETVLVSPGTYIEQISITKNISLVSSVKNKAIIQAPATTKMTADADGHASLVTITGGATSVTVKDMTVSGPMFTDGCGDSMYGIYVKNANATITGNRVDAIRQSRSDLWGCQQGVGIRFGSQASAYVGHSGTISNNIVNGPAKAAVVVDGDNTKVDVTGNTLIGLNVTGIIGQNGIQFGRGAKGTADSNTITGFRYGGTFENTNAAGILVFNILGGVTLNKNNISGNDEGIAIFYDSNRLADGSPDFTIQFPTNIVVTNNQVNSNMYLGIHIDPFSTGNSIWNNTANGNSGGWDQLDEHADFKSNNWGTDSTNFNTFGVGHAGLMFAY